MEYSHKYIQTDTDLTTSPSRACTAKKFEMETEYAGFYLGSAMLTKATTGLGVIQKPLREKYFALMKSADSKLGQEIWVRVNPSGITLVFPSVHSGEPMEDFYEISSIHFVEAVHFVTIKQKNKKYQCAFVPIENNNNANASSDKLFVPLEKKFKHLTKISHPPMLACVMRRTTGVKAVDCHIFVFSRVEDALSVADMIHSCQVHHGNTHFYYGRPTCELWDMNLEPDVIPRNLGSADQRHPVQGPEGSGENYAVFRGRGYDFRQEHLQMSEVDNLRHSHSNMNRKYDQPQNLHSDYQNELEMRYKHDSDLRNRYKNGHSTPDKTVGDRPYGYIAPKHVFDERDTQSREYEFASRLPLRERARSYGDRSDDRFLGGLSSRNEFHDRSAGSFEFEARFNRNPDKFPQAQLLDRTSEPAWGNLLAPFERGAVNRDDMTDSRTRHSELPKLFYGDGHQSPTISPYGRSPPRALSPQWGPSSPRTPSVLSDENIFSASNLESRQDAVDSQGKPVAKVPPNRVAGVKVLPSFPIPGAKNHLRPVSPRASDAHAVSDSKPLFHNLGSKMDGNEIRNLSESALEKGPYRQNRIQSDYQQYQSRFDGPRHDVKSRAQSVNCGYNSKREYESDNERNHDVPAHSPKLWSFDDEKQKFLKLREHGDWNAGKRPQSAHDFIETRYQQGYADRSSKNTKDAEITDMLSHMKTRYNDQKEIDFEASLGYLP